MAYTIGSNECKDNSYTVCSYNGTALITPKKKKARSTHRCSNKITGLYKTINEENTVAASIYPGACIKPSTEALVGAGYNRGAQQNYQREVIVAVAT